MIGVRILRKRSVLTVIFLISLIYFLANILKMVTRPAAESLKKPLPSLEAIDWRIESTNENETAITCKNSVQGWAWIVDDKGFVCSRSNLMSNGCCAKPSSRFSCNSCRSNGCCVIFEYCVSCCMQPDKKMKLRKTFVRIARAFPYLFSSVSNVFELCLSKCRTSSHSLVHENAYRDPVLKYCYGSDLPTLQLTK